MARRTRALSGAAKDAYLRRTILSDPAIGTAAAERLLARLQSELALVSLRRQSLPIAAASPPESAGSEQSLAASAPVEPAPKPQFPAAATAAETSTTTATDDFDPYRPNVVVVIRTRGRDAVLAELDIIDDVERLRRLAREQQLGIAPDLASATDIRHAIVAAAERRIANRRAAAS